MDARSRWPVLVSFLVAALVAAASLGGIVLPSTYARETPSWAAQGLGQDWVNLLVVVPVVAIASWRSLLGSRAARLVLGGALFYTTYSYVLYAFAVHFNALFLVYCAALGAAGFALVGVAAGLLGEDPEAWYRPGAPLAVAGWVLAVVACLFAALWLGEILPALARGAPPASLAEVGSFTNPVHVLDLSLLLPTMLVAGLALVRRRRVGLVLGPMLLTFNVLMPLAIAGMVLSMRLQGLPGSLAPLAAFGLIVPVAVALLVLLLRDARPARRSLCRGEGSRAA